MKYKVLLIGEASDMIDRFFKEGDCFFECITTPLNVVALESSIKRFQPQLIVYCMEKEDRKQMLNISKLAGLESEMRIPLIIIGGQYDYDLYMVFTGKSAELFLQKAKSFDSILEALLLYASEIEHEAGTVHSGSESKEGRKHIMVIDDSSNMLRVISNILGADYEVATAINSKVAWRYLQSKPVDLILLDYEMPDENGSDVYKKLKQHPGTAGIPVIFLSGVKDVDIIRSTLSMQPEGFLLKPVMASVLKDKIHEVLQAS